MSASTIIAVFEEPNAASAAVATLVDGGVETDRISVLCSDPAKLESFPELLRHETPAEGSEKAIDTGAAAAVGVGASLLAGAVLTAAGLPLVALGALGSIAVTGPFAALMASRGMDDAAADFYDREVADGRILVAIEPLEETSADVVTADDATSRETLIGAGGRTFALPTK